MCNKNDQRSECVGEEESNKDHVMNKGTKNLMRPINSGSEKRYLTLDKTIIKSSSLIAAFAALSIGGDTYAGNAQLTSKGLRGDAKAIGRDIRAVGKRVVRGDYGK